MSTNKSPELTDKQKLFAIEYLNDFNATAAAIRAGYSAKTATAAASRLLTNVKVQELIKQEKEKLFEKSKIKVENVIEQLASIAFYDIEDFVEIDPTGTKMKFKELKEIPKTKRKAIKRIKRGAFGIEIEFDSRTKALEMLMDYYGKGTAENNPDNEEETTGVVMMPSREEKPSDQDLLDENGEYIQV